MTGQEFKIVLAEMAGHWPRHPVSKISEAAWFNLLRDEDQDRVLGAVRVLAMSKEFESFPPNGGQILRYLQESAAPAAWDQVLDEIRSMLKSLNADHRYTSGPIGVIWHEPDADEWSDPAIADLVERSGGVGAWMQKLTIGFPGTADDTTFIAQQRRIWDALRNRSIEHGRVAVLDAGTRAALDRGVPQQIGDVIAGVLPQTVNEPEVSA